MPNQTRIQLRRGYSIGYTGPMIGGIPTGVSGTWAVGTSLAPGEIGFELDTGKFKIGTNGITTWGSLPYAGGSDIAAQTGIGYTFNSSANAYTVYSLITGVSGGQDGITFQTLPLSGLLNNTNASGTYYQIGLSNKLENFHDSNINISGNLISSSSDVNGTGITISGFNNSAISLNPSGGAVTQSGINIRNLTETVTVTSALGGLSIGESFTTASGITSVLKKLLEKTLDPTATAPSASLGINYSLANSNQEIGTTYSNLTLTASYASGLVRGTGLGAGWDANGEQGPRAGAPTKYTIAGVDKLLVNSHTIPTYVTELSNSFSLSINHATGIVPKNSLGVNSTLLTQLSAGTVTSSVLYNGYRGLFYGFSKSNTNVPTTSAEIRNLFESPTVNASGSIVRPTKPYTFTMNIPSGTQKIMVAVPSGYVSLSSGISVINAVNQPETYSTTTINVSGASGYAASTYFLHYYTVPSPIALDTTHTITVT
jgi:hypothetical protein